MKSNIFHTFAVVASLLLVSSLQMAAQSVAEADSAYLKGDFARASQLYEEVMKKDGVSAQILYNAGNSYLAQDNMGEAMVCFQRARKLDPRNGSIRNNIAYVNSKVADRNRADLRGKQRQVTPESPSFFRELYRAIAVDCSSNMWFVLTVVCFIAALGMWAAYSFLDVLLLRKIGFFSSFVLLFASLLFMIFSFMAADYFQSEDQAVVLSYKEPLLSEPKSGAPASSTPVNAGTVVEILPYDTEPADSAWVKVRLNHDFIGWIPAKDLKPF